MRDYGKVHTRFWSSETARSLSDDGRLLALYLITSPHSTIAGVFPLPDGYICEDMQWSVERVSEGFRELSEKGFADRCATTKWVWVREHLKWNPPENPNQRKSAAKVASTIPDKCSWRQKFLASVGPSLGLSPTNPPLTVVKPFANQEPEPEQEPEQDKKPTASSAGKLPPCRYADIVALYHEVLPEMPTVRLMNDARKRALSKTWAWVLTSSTPEGARRATTSDEAIAWLRRYFERARENDFLMGRTARTGEHAGWKCDLDFLLTDRGMKQVIEKTLEAA